MKQFDPEVLETLTPEEFFEQRYANSSDRKRGNPGKILQEKVAGLPAGRVLELGCSTGDDSLWLAEQGWHVTAVDISNHATQIAQRLAKEAELDQQIQFLTCDLTKDFPGGTFELVCALYLQSPYDFPRIDILRTATHHIVSGGHLLIVTHATGPSWSPFQHLKLELPSLESDWEALGLSTKEWQILDISLRKRLMKGPQGQEEELKDNLIFIRRR